MADATTVERRRIQYNRDFLCALWLKNLQMSLEMRAEIERSGIMLDATDTRNAKRRQNEGRCLTEPSEEITKIIRAFKHRDRRLGELSSDPDLSKWSDLVVKHIRSAVSEHNFQPVSKLWREVSTLPDLHSECPEVKELARQCRSTFEANSLTNSNRGAATIAGLLDKEVESQTELEEIRKQRHDCILYISHLYLIGSLSATVYCCMHKIALYRLRFHSEELCNLGLQATLEELMQKVTRPRHMVAYFCDKSLSDRDKSPRDRDKSLSDRDKSLSDRDKSLSDREKSLSDRDKSLNDLVEDSTLTEWTALLSKHLRSAVRNNQFKPKSSPWTSVCNKIRLYPRPPGIDELARQCREFFVRPEEILQAGDDEAKHELCDFVLLMAYIIENDCEISDSLALECMLELMSWKLRSNDGNLDQWQQAIQDLMDPLVQKFCQTMVPGSQILLPEEKSALEPWEAAASKGTYFHYECLDLLSGYAKKHMPEKIKLFKTSFEGQLKELLGATQGSSSSRVLSLGCGPGSELLAAMEVWADQTGMRRNFSCVGVDKYWWLKSAFFASQCQIFQEISSQAQEVSLKTVFVQQDMMEFVANSQLKFELAVMSFVGVDWPRAEDFVNKLADLLIEDGAILLIDNFVEDVLDLMDLGFRPTAVWLSSFDREAPGQKGQAEAAQAPKSSSQSTSNDSLYAAKVCLVYQKHRNAIDSDETFQVFQPCSVDRCNVKVHNFVTKGHSMGPKRRIAAYVTAAKALVRYEGQRDEDELIAKDLVDEFCSKYKSSSWKCSLATDSREESEATQFLLFRQADKPQKPWLLLAETNRNEDAQSEGYFEI